MAELDQTPRKMPVQVYEKTLDLWADTVNIVPLDLEKINHEIYPWLPLKKTGQQQNLSLAILVLENSLVRFQISPTLGGRIVEWHDKRTGKDIVPKMNSIETQESGARGVEIRHGIEWQAGAKERMNRLGTVDFQIREPEYEEAPAAIFLHELMVGTEFSWTVCLTLYPHDAALTIDFKLLNRSLDIVPASSGLQFWCSSNIQSVPESSGGFYDTNSDAGFHIECLAGWIESEHQTTDSVQAWSPSALAGLGPRKTQEWKLRLTPVSGIGEATCMSPHITVALSAEQLNIQVPRTMNGTKVFLKTKEHQTFESLADYSPDTISQSNLKNLPSPPVALLIQDQNKTTLLKYEPNKATLHKHHNQPLLATDYNPRIPELVKTLFENPLTSSFNAIENVNGFEHLAHLGHTIQSIAKSDYEKATEHLDQYLHYNALDPLVWWLKAHIQKKINSDNEQTNELLNAHFLAPLEPILRAESFFGQHLPDHKEGSPLTKYFADYPDAGLECIKLLMEMNLFQSAAEIADDILRHSNVPMIRILIADLLLSNTNMIATAIEHITIAGKKDISPPFPWREIEMQAIRRLSKKFPDNSYLNTLLQLISAKRISRNHN